MKFTSVGAILASMLWDGLESKKNTTEFGTSADLQKWVINPFFNLMLNKMPAHSF
jgi:hypothetical protein